LFVELTELLVAKGLVRVTRLLSVFDQFVLLLTKRKSWKKVGKLGGLTESFAGEQRKKLLISV